MEFLNNLRTLFQIFLDVFPRFKYYPSNPLLGLHVIVQSQQWKHQDNL